MQQVFKYKRASKSSHKNISKDSKKGEVKRIIAHMETRHSQHDSVSKYCIFRILLSARWDKICFVFFNVCLRFHRPKTCVRGWQFEGPVSSVDLCGCHGPFRGSDNWEVNQWASYQDLSITPTAIYEFMGCVSLIDDSVIFSNENIGDQKFIFGLGHSLNSSRITFLNNNNSNNDKLSVEKIASSK